MTQQTTDEIDREALTQMNGIVDLQQAGILTNPEASEMLRNLRKDIAEKRAKVQKMRGEHDSDDS